VATTALTVMQGSLSNDQSNFHGIPQANQAVT
jgi:hypothetical protein